MHYLIGIGALLFFAFIAPAKASLVLVFVVLVSVLATIVFARVVAGAEVTVSEAVRAIGVSLALLLLAVTVFGSFVAGTGIRNFAGASGWAVFGWFASAYALGFVAALRLAFIQGAVVALGTAGVSAIAMVLIRKVSA
jgi:hypothetical protein